MPATAGRVRMPANNRLSVSDSLRTSEIWQKTVKYDPYAPSEADVASDNVSNTSACNTGINDKAKGLFALARLTGNSSSVTPGSCRKCGQVGHLAYLCRNYLSASNKIVATPTIRENNDEEDDQLDEQAEKRLLGIESDSASSSASSSGSNSSDSSESEAERKNRRQNRNVSRGSRKKVKKSSKDIRSRGKEYRFESRGRRNTDNKKKNKDKHRKKDTKKYENRRKRVRSDSESGDDGKSMRRKRC